MYLIVWMAHVCKLIGVKGDTVAAVVVVQLKIEKKLRWCSLLLLSSL